MHAYIDIKEWMPAGDTCPEDDPHLGTAIQ